MYIHLHISLLLRHINTGKSSVGGGEIHAMLNNLSTLKFKELPCRGCEESRRARESGWGRGRLCVETRLQLCFMLLVYKTWALLIYVGRAAMHGRGAMHHLRGSLINLLRPGHAVESNERWERGEGRGRPRLAGHTLMM